MIKGVSFDLMTCYVPACWHQDLWMVFVLTINSQSWEMDFALALCSGGG